LLFRKVPSGPAAALLFTLLQLSLVLCLLPVPLRSLRSLPAEFLLSFASSCWCCVVASPSCQPAMNAKKANLEGFDLRATCKSRLSNFSH